MPCNSLTVTASLKSCSVIRLIVSGQFFGTTIFLLSLSSAMTVAVIKLHFSGEHGARVPAWLRMLVLNCIAKCLLLNDRETDISEGWQRKKVADTIVVADSFGFRFRRHSIYYRSSRKLRFTRNPVSATATQMSDA